MEAIKQQRPMQNRER